MRLIACTFCLLLSSCSYEQHMVDAKKVLESEGYSSVERMNYVFLGCGRDDAYRIEFEAVSVIGKHVHGFACAGMWFKGWTIRIDRVSA